MRLFATVLVLAALFACPALAVVDESSSDAGWSYIEPVPGDTWLGSRDVLFDNGPLVNSPGTGVGGADESVLQNLSLGMNTLGAGHQYTLQYRVADDFVIPAGEVWNVMGITFFAYQTGAPTNPSPITGVYFEIYDAMPPAGNVVGGNIASNGLASTAWSNIYRVTEATTGAATDRAIFANQTSMTPVLLGPGTYWVAWMTSGNLSSGPWAPPVTINGQTTTGNALQSLDAGATYAALTDTGTLTPQGLPFLVQGTLETTAVANSSWSELKALY